MITSEKKSHHYLHSFCVRPEVHFDSQKSEEVVILILRQHPLTQLDWILNSFFLVIILFFMNFFIAQFFVLNQLIVFNAFGFVFIFSYVWINALLWYFNVGIVTNMRILDVDLFNVLYKEVTETTIENVSDVTSKVGGYLASFFQYGTIEVKTEGFTQNIEFENVPKPSEAANIINELIQHGTNK